MIWTEFVKKIHTIEWIIFDAMFIEPIPTGNSEQSTRRAIERIYCTRAISRRPIHHKVDYTGADSRPKRIYGFKTPIFNLWILKEQIFAARELACIHACGDN